MAQGSFYVYVVELDRPPHPTVYVGSSALAPEERFVRHQQGGIGTSRYVRRQGVRLRPDLYARLNPFTSRDDAWRAEHRLRDQLERRGYHVLGSCDPRKKSCFF
jgi:hypothetical protein